MEEHGIAFCATYLDTLHVNVLDFVECFITSSILLSLLTLLIHVSKVPLRLYSKLPIEMSRKLRRKRGSVTS